VRCVDFQRALHARAMRKCASFFMNSLQPNLYSDGHIRLLKGRCHGEHDWANIRNSRPVDFDKEISLRLLLSMRFHNALQLITHFPRQ